MAFGFITPNLKRNLETRQENSPKWKLLTDFDNSEEKKTQICESSGSWRWVSAGAHTDMHFQKTLNGG